MKTHFFAAALLALAGLQSVHAMNLESHDFLDAGELAELDSNTTGEACIGADCEIDKGCGCASEPPNLQNEMLNALGDLQQKSKAVEDALRAKFAEHHELTKTRHYDIAGKVAVTPTLRGAKFD